MHRNLGKYALPALCAALVALTVAAFFPVTRADFINYDDPFYVTNNPNVRDGLNGPDIRWALTAMHASNWHPLTWLSHMLDCTLFGLNARGHHVTNLAWHTANVLLLFLLWHRLTGRRWRAAFVAALFAVHPLHVESVAWISERKDVLSTCFGLLALLAYARYARKLETRNSKLETRSPGRRASYVLALLCFALSLLSKPMLVTLPCLLLLLDYWPLGRVSGVRSQVSGEALRTWRRLVLEKLPFFALAAGSCVLTVLAQVKSGAVAPIGDIPLASRLANSVIAYGWYLLKLVWPVDLAIIYPLFPTRPVAQIVGASVVLAALTALALWQVRRRPHLFVGWFWYVGLLVPVIGLVQVGMQCYADRYTYLPYIGLFLVAAWLAAEFVGAETKRRAAAGIAATVVVLTCAVLTNQQTRHWRDAEAVFTHAVSVTRSNYIAHNNLGFALADRKEHARAIEHYQAALRAAPLYADAFNNLGCAWLGLKRFDQALDAFRTAVRIRPNDPRLRNNLGSALHDCDNLTNAIAEYEACLLLAPDYAEAHYNLANSLSATGRRAEARDHYQRALALQPKYAEAHLNLAIDLLASREHEAALQHARRAAALKPDWLPAHAGVAAALKALGRADEAIAQYRLALRLDPNHAGTRFQLGLLRGTQGQLAESRKELATAVDLVPDNADFQLALATALDREGDTTNALAHYRVALQLNADLPEALNNVAWILAAHRDDRLRDGAEAVRLAERACALTEYREAMMVGTLAAAYAEAGRFDEAVRTGEQARALAAANGDTALARKNEELLGLYRAGKAYRQDP